MPSNPAVNHRFSYGKRPRFSAECGMKPSFLCLLLAFAGCTTVRYPSGVKAFETGGAVKLVDVKANGDIHVEDVSSPAISALNALTTGAFAWFTGGVIR